MKSLARIEAEVSLPWFQEPASGPYIEPDESNSKPHVLFFLRDIIILSMHRSSNWSLYVSVIIRRNGSSNFMTDFFMCSRNTLLIRFQVSITMWDFRFSRSRVWSLESFGMSRLVFSMEWTDVSEVRTASIIRVIQRDYTALHPRRL
jgi:hypothetical protein